MGRIKEPPIGTTAVPNYKSPHLQVVKSLRKGYDHVRAKIANKSQTIQAMQGKLRDTQESRDEWKRRAKDAEAKLQALQAQYENSQQERKKKHRNL